METFTMLEKGSSWKQQVVWDGSNSPQLVLTTLDSAQMAVPSMESKADLLRIRLCPPKLIVSNKLPLRSTNKNSEVFRTCRMRQQQRLRVPYKVAVGSCLHQEMLAYHFRRIC
jgi:hypothetical protein